MKIKIDDKKIVYAVTILFTKDGNDTKFEMNYSIQKQAKTDVEAIEASILNLQTKHKTVRVMLQAATALTPSIFLDDETKRSSKPKVLTIK